MPTSIALTPHLEGFIRSQVASGRYNNASEVVRDGLRLLERQQREEALKLKALRRAAAAGFTELDTGRFVEMDATQVDAYIAALGDRAVAKRNSAKPKRR